MAEDQPHPRIQRLRERKHRHKQRSRPYRLGFGVVGGTLVLAGLVLSLPLVPGPGFLLILIGLGMLALEFDRVERLVERLVHRLDDVEAKAKAASPAQRLLVAAVVAVGAAAAITAAIVWDIPWAPV
ncbi:MAG TPA: PGPGW domain-containing protein [Gaiellaceae bacterium]|nr:PGPGW domain-containing protein [Gaiellaceae bacterium]